MVDKLGFPGGSYGKASVCNAGNPGSIPGSGRSPGEGNGNPLQYSCLENPMDRGAWQATVLGVTKSQTRLSNFTLLMTQCTIQNVIFVFRFLKIEVQLICKSVLVSGAQQSDSVIHIFFFRLFSPVTTHSSILAWKIPWAQKPLQAAVLEVTKSRTQLSVHAMPQVITNTEYSSLCCIVGPCCLFYIQCVYILIPVSQFIPLPLSPLVTVSLFRNAALITGQCTQEWKHLMGKRLMSWSFPKVMDQMIRSVPGKGRWRGWAASERLSGGK